MQNAVTQLQQWEATAQFNATLQVETHGAHSWQERKSQPWAAQLTITSNVSTFRISFMTNLWTPTSVGRPLST